MMWHSVLNFIQSQGSEISASVRVPPDSPWFQGHFPGEPILPGVAQLAMVFDAISKAQNKALRVSSVRRIRFKQIIRPDDLLTIIAAPLKQNDGSYSFRILANNETVCSGVMTVEEQTN